MLTGIEDAEIEKQFEDYKKEISDYRKCKIFLRDCFFVCFLITYYII